MFPIIFGARAQIVVALVMLAVTLAQTYLWMVVRAPTTTDVFFVSMEALLFASYNTFATALGFRATERVETHVDNITTGDVDVTVEK